jgi:trigger factor
MNVSVEELSPIRKKLVIEVAADKVAEKIEASYSKIAQTADLKGFRKGKVPRNLLEKHFAPRMEHEVTGSLINETLYRALLDNQIVAVSQPEIVDSAQLEKGKGFSYQAEVEVKPEVVARDYTGLALEKEIFQIGEDAVDQRLEEMATSRARLEVTTRKIAREGDTVILDFEGYVDDTPFENGAATDYQLELGSNSFIPGFEEQLVGLKRDEEKDVEVTFPDNYGSKDLAGKPAVFKVKLKEIKEKIQPKLDDEFAGEFGCETLDELRRRIEADIVKQEQGRIDGQLQEQLMNALVEKNPLEVPEMLGMHGDTFATTYWPMAEQQVKGELILEAIASQEEIKTEAADIENKVKEIAEESNAPLEKVQEYFNKPEMRQGLEHQIQHDKIIAYLIDKAVVTEVEPKQEETEQKES